MATLTLRDARRIAAHTRPWTLRMECVDPSTNTNKYWFATGRGTNESVETGSGRIGAKPALRLVSFAKFVGKVQEKLGKGYDYANTRFVRMSPSNLIKLGGHKPSAAPTGAGVKPQAPQAPAPTAPNPVAPAAPAAPPAVATGGKFVAPPMGTPKPGLPALDGPYVLIVAVHPVKDGFEGIDEDGDVVMDLTLQGGQDLVQDYGIPMVWAL